MAKKSSIAKQKHREQLVALKKEQRDQLKKKAYDMSFSDEERHEARIRLNQLPRNSSAVRLRNRCQLSGRCRGYLRKFKLSRLCFREKARSGEIPGVTKSSW